MGLSSVLLSQTQSFSFLWSPPTEWGSLVGGIGKKLSVHWARVRVLENATFVIYDTPRSQRHESETQWYPTAFSVCSHHLLWPHPIHAFPCTLLSSPISHFMALPMLISSHMECPLPPSLIKTPACLSQPRLFPGLQHKL